MALHVGDEAPQFTLPSSTGGTISLQDLAGRKVALYFYPRDDTSGCTKEACGFRDAEAELKAAGIEVLGVSADDLESHHKFAEKFSLPFPLLADTDTTVSNAYGAYGERQARGGTVIGVRRMTYLIDEAGKIQKIWPTVQPEGHAAEVLEAARAG